MARAVFAYIPVVHQGVFDFLDANAGDIFILDNTKAASEYVYFERDMRALPALKIADALRAHGYEHVSVIDPQDLGKLKGYDEVVSPKDEAITFFIERYVPDLTVVYGNGFMRWNKLISTQELVVPPHRQLTRDEFSREVIAILHVEAEKSSDWWRQVAAAVIRDGEVLFADHNRHLPSSHAPYINGDPRSNLDAGQHPNIGTAIHAEAALVARAARNGVALTGADVYVTTFPCSVCARLLSEAGIARVYYDKGYSTLDAEDILKGAGIEIVKVEMGE